MGTLYIVATPIGNLSDITLRALEVLRDADVILCEDTRVTKKLLNHYKIVKPLLSYHQHSKLSKINKIEELLDEDKTLALVSDAGTPGISDPGNGLIARLLSSGKNVKIIPVSGPSALSTLISVAGLDMSKFLFLGFLPHKKGRLTFINKIIRQLAESEYPVVLYESKYRLLKLLENFSKIKVDVVIGRELTKMYEEIVRGDIEEVINYFKNNPDKLKGEFAIVLSPKKLKR